jgi:hypothetical protein
MPLQPEVLKSHIAAIRAVLGDDARKPIFIETLNPLAIGARQRRTETLGPTASLHHHAVGCCGAEKVCVRIAWLDQVHRESLPNQPTLNEDVIRVTEPGSPPLQTAKERTTWRPRHLTAR